MAVRYMSTRPKRNSGTPRRNSAGPQRFIGRRPRLPRKGGHPIAG